MSPAASRSARTPSRTIRLSSASSTRRVGPSGTMPFWEPAEGSGRVVTPSLLWGEHPRKLSGRHPRRLARRRRLWMRRCKDMRIETSVTSISWIPQEAVEGVTKLPFGMGVAHYDAPPPDHIDDLDALADGDRFRFANRLSAWIEVEDGRITAQGYSGGGRIGSTTMRLAGRDVIFAAVAFPDRQHTPAVGDDWVTFVQTAGGRTGVPAPRRVRRPPFVQIAAPLAWTTLTLTMFADGRATHELSGASSFPRHWVFDAKGDLSLKSGLVSFRQWYRNAFGKHTPWGDED